MARPMLLAVAVVLAAPARAALTLVNNDTACRASTDTSQWCSESATKNCSDKYSVIIEATLPECKLVCNTMAATCTGIEFFATQPSLGDAERNRCEIWKKPIMAVKTGATNYRCFNQTSMGTVDASLFFMFKLSSNFDLLTVAASPHMSNITTEMQHAIVDAFNTTKAISQVGGAVPATAVHVWLNQPEDKLDVVIDPPVGTDVLAMYAVLRPAGSDFNDGTNSIAADLATGLNDRVKKITGYETLLKAGQTTPGLAFASKSRRLLDTMPTQAQTMTQTTTMTTETTSTNTQSTSTMSTSTMSTSTMTASTITTTRRANAARDSRLRCPLTSIAAVVAAAATASA